MLHCPECNRILIDMTSDGGVKLRSRMVLFQGSGAHAICPSCKTKVEVPLMVDVSKLPQPTKTKHFVTG